MIILLENKMIRVLVAVFHFCIAKVDASFGKPRFGCRHVSKIIHSRIRTHSPIRHSQTLNRWPLVTATYQFRVDTHLFGLVNTLYS